MPNRSLKRRKILGRMKMRRVKIKMTRMTKVGQENYRDRMRSVWEKRRD